MFNGPRLDFLKTSVLSAYSAVVAIEHWPHNSIVVAVGHCQVIFYENEH
jgi:hypothetical protein